MQGTYRTFVRNARFVTPDSAPHIAFMAACVVEMHSLDMGAAYEHAFSAVRQLAQLLRAGLAQRSQQALQEVYSWPTLHALELWARLLACLADRGVCPFRLSGLACCSGACRCHSGHEVLQEVYGWPTLRALQLWACFLSSLPGHAVRPFCLSKPCSVYLCLSIWKASRAGDVLLAQPACPGALGTPPVLPPRSSNWST